MQPKIKFFMWLLWQDCIPHRNLLLGRGIIREGGCPRCQESIEDSAHIIVNYPKSRGIWDHEGVPQVVYNDF